MRGTLRALALASTFAPVTIAQTGDGAPAFEVASVKPVDTSRPAAQSPALGFRYTRTRVEGNSQIFAMIQDAYSLRPFQIEGPDWISREVYEIAATMPEGTSRETAQLMLRALLADRFGLRFHREMREQSVYALVQAKSGAKLKPADPEKAKDKIVDTPFGPRKGFMSTGGRGVYIATAATMDTLAGQLGGILQRPVLDQTGLKGYYAFDLRWSPEDDTEVISLLERQLGLRLESRKLPVEMFVVDHVERTPTPN